MLTLASICENGSRKMLLNYLGNKGGCYLCLNFSVCSELQKFGGYGGAVVVDGIVESGVLICINGICISTIFQENLYTFLVLALCCLWGLSQGKDCQLKKFEIIFPQVPPNSYI